VEAVMRGPASRKAVWIATAVAACGLALAWLRPAGPVYKGRTLNYWIGRQAGGSFAERAEASQALKQAGPEAVPALARLLALREGDLTRRLQAKLSQWAPSLISPPPNVVAIHLEAFEVLGRLGSAAAPAAPALLACFDAADDAERQLLRNVWLGVDPAARSVLLNGGLKHPSLAVRTWAVESADLTGLEVNGEPVLWVLLELSRARDPMARRAAAGRLTTLALLHDSAEAEAAVRRLAQEPDPAIAIRILTSLSWLEKRAATSAGPAGPPLEPDLPEGAHAKGLSFVKLLLQHPDCVVRVHAAMRYWHLTRDTPGVLPVLIAALKDPSVTWQAAAALRELGPAAEPAIPALLEAVEREPVHRADRTPASSAMGLAAIGPAALPGLLKLLDHPSLDVRFSAAHAIRRFGPDARDAVEGLLRLLEEPSPEAQTLASDTLGAIGPAAAEALPQLEALERNSRGYPQAAAAEAIRRIRREPVESTGPGAPPVG
jgi:HEAT repeat protein